MRKLRITVKSPLRWELCRDTIAGTAWLTLIVDSPEDPALVYEWIGFRPGNLDSVEAALSMVERLTEEYADAGHTLATLVGAREQMLRPS